ncbi:hypothetical protein Esi_0226_0008 [Ectocarpus siliculosus]|uniref:Uncharacterized protein n=1 Tax=Ectocarpus siliculosus TaxID=2880 RepID=D7FRZ8_ECTSI|nr:hypothetical protein Esi_0226_0008 [Ectocarpus siliculosus]|eukprot:CBJ30939.1 hypothetical protein Esi_0226_0008 [Ectocarpus siliculosus]
MGEDGLGDVMCLSAGRAFRPACSTAFRTNLSTYLCTWVGLLPSAVSCSCSCLLLYGQGLLQTLPGDFTPHEKEASLWSGPSSMLPVQQVSYVQMCEVEGVRVDGVGCTSFAAFKPALDVGSFSIPEDWCKSPGSDETDPPGDADGTAGSDDSGSAATHTDGDDEACSDDERADDRTKGRAAEEAARREELEVVRWSRRRGERMCHSAKGTVRQARARCPPGAQAVKPQFLENERRESCHAPFTLADAAQKVDSLPLASAGLGIHDDFVGSGGVLGVGFDLGLQASNRCQSTCIFR